MADFKGFFVSIPYNGPTVAELDVDRADLREGRLQRLRFSQEPPRRQREDGHCVR